MEPVDNLNDKIKGLQKEIEEIQKGCKHKKRIISFVQGKNYMWLCQKCKKELAWPTPKEIEDNLK
jgi:hypothetical protein